MSLLRALALSSVLLSAPALAAPPPSVPYTWKSVQIVGGGFVDGFVFRPAARDVLYARAGIGGAYRRRRARSPPDAGISRCASPGARRAAGSPTTVRGD